MIDAHQLADVFGGCAGCSIKETQAARHGQWRLISGFCEWSLLQSVNESAVPAGATDGVVSETVTCGVKAASSSW